MTRPAIIRSYAPSRFGQLHYRIGQPEAEAQQHRPLLCLHQTPGNGADWLPIMSTLAARRTIVAADTPGYGMSDPPPEPARIEDFAEIMIDLMDGLAERGLVAPGPFDVMGYHTGSLIATETARRFPDRIGKAVVFGLAAYPADVRQDKLARLRDNFPVPQRNLDHVEKLWSIMQTLMDPRMSVEDMHIGMAECLRLGSRMPWAYISVYRYDFLAAMPQVAQPVLIVNPQDDLWDVTQAVSHLFPAGRREDMPGVRHGVLAIEHDRVVEMIEAFLAA